MNLINVVFIFFVIWECVDTFVAYRQRKQIISSLLQPTSHQLADERFDERELTSYELERLEREEEFDKRINRLKDELSQQQKVIRHGFTADELHPSVHNLPHNTVQTKYDVLPDVEIAE